jgi:hypothetical protein
VDTRFIGTVIFIGGDRTLSIKQFVKGIPVVGDVVRRVYNSLKTRGFSLGNASERQPFPGSLAYWESRYLTGGDSGVGSYGKFAEFKAEILNSFVAQNKIETVIEFGCGDGNQLSFAQYPKYLGIDVSPTAIRICKNKFGSDRTKRFLLDNMYAGETADLALSLDVIYHLVEDSTYEEHMRHLFGAAARFVAIYSSNSDNNDGYENSHVKHRKFTNWIGENTVDWVLDRIIHNEYPYNGDYTKGSFSDFYFYRRTN